MTTELTDHQTTLQSTMPLGLGDPQAWKSEAPAIAAPPTWRELESRLASWKHELRELDRKLLSGAADAPAQTQRVERTFAELEVLTNEVLGAHGGMDAASVAALGARLQCEVLPYVLLSHVAERWYVKPRGYAGDYLSIAAIYADSPSGVGRIGPVLDRCFLNMAAAKAVRNRRGLMKAELRDVLDGLRGARPARVTSLACGPATEVFDTYLELADPKALETTLVDLDLAALSAVADGRDGVGLRRSMRLVHENLIHLASGRRRLEVAEQDLVYTVGLIDYLDDDTVVRLLDFIHGLLRAGGRAIVGNFHPRNPTRGMLDHVLEWRLIHRDEEDMHRLFCRSSFGRRCARIAFEQEGINLFAVGEK